MKEEEESFSLEALRCRKVKRYKLSELQFDEAAGYEVE